MTQPNRAATTAFLIALASTALVAWRTAPMRPGGDEPHYLVATQSLLQDGDLRTENNYAQRDYAPYYPPRLEPQYLVRGKDGAIYPVHAPGLPALVAPAFAVAGYPGVVWFLVLTLGLASALVWRIAWLATGDVGAAWFGWATVAASCTWVFQSFLVYPDALGGAALACGVWLVLRLDADRPPSAVALVAGGSALAMLPWLHTRFVVLAAGLGVMIALRLWRLGARRVVAFLTVPAVSAAAWFAFFWVIYGTPNPVAQWGGSGASRIAWIPGGLAGLLLDQQFGLLPYAPALVLGLAGLLVGTAPGWRRATRVQLLTLVVLPYLAATVSYAMWWGGWSVPARMMTALLPLLAPAGAVLWLHVRRPAVRNALLVAVAWTMFATITLAFAGRGRLAFNVRQDKAGLWFDWLVPLLRWSQALPAFFRASDQLGRESLPLPSFYLVSAIWASVMAATVAGAAWLSRVACRWGVRSAAPAMTVTACVLALPFGTVLALRAQAADASRPLHAQVTFLSRIAGGHWLVLDTRGPRMMPAARALARIRMTALSSNPPAALFVSPLPAGRYRLSAERPGAPGEVTIGQATRPIATLGDGSVDLELPVAVNALLVRGAVGRHVALQPLSVLPRRSPARARGAARYGAATAYFLDDDVYIEEGGFWTRATQSTEVVLQSDPGEPSVQLELRNGPSENRIQGTIGGRPFAVDAAPRAVVLLPVTFNRTGAAWLQIQSAAAFVPARVDSASSDERSLGVYVRAKAR